ncbi:hypothetical protein [Gimesia chilikensis]|uniref:Uncharacterized protein n=1 Tax=Gimesia chilikensis TaxID=2605989 RepID=A0A517PHX2_9PLAN|nr:hypothetical protein [Gimesia chilikensis]QDT18984.1 hypothetical protein HG66A1_07470 [Gimesia chilikensis]
MMVDQTMSHFRKNRLKYLLLTPILLLLIYQYFENPTSADFSSLPELYKHRDLGDRLINLPCAGTIRLTQPHPYTSNFCIQGTFQDTDAYLKWRFGEVHLKDAVEFVEAAHSMSDEQQPDDMYWKDSFYSGRYAHEIYLFKDGRFYDQVRLLRE